MRAFHFVLSSFIAFSAFTTSLPAWADARCATAEQKTKIRDAAAQTPFALPNVLSEKTGISEALFVTGMDAQAAIGTSAKVFPEVWASLTGWERPAVLVQLDKNNTLEVFGRLGPTVNQRDGYVLIEVQGAGIGGHFKTDSIDSLYMVRVPNNEKKTVYGMLFFNAQGETLFGVYSVDTPRPAVIAMLARDAYQKTWDLIAAQPRACAP